MSTPFDELELQAQLVGASRERVAARMSRRELRVYGAHTLLFVVAAASLAAYDAPAHASEWLLAAVFAAAVALASRVELEIGSGFASPVEVMLIPALFALPAGVVPVVVSVGLVAAQTPSYIRGHVHRDRIIVAAGNASYALAPALVFLLLYDPRAPAATWATLTVAALCAQFAADVLLSGLRERLAVGVAPRSLLKPFAWIMFVDACLAPIGFAASLAGARWGLGYLLPLPLLLLARLFAHERTDRLTNALNLSAAYRGTAFLLGDVVEADDAYTGAHSRDVVALACAVADNLGADSHSQHLVELTALLHDVGKLKIPNTIINKPGPLTADERAVIETHTITGERLLSQVGGLLQEVGTIVRSCHERYDGQGYPDGLRGDQIPLVARIVCCCDAFSAMTSTRSYRPAMSPVAARAEIARNRGTQFDPDVVDALLALTTDRSPSTDVQEVDPATTTSRAA